MKAPPECHGCGDEVDVTDSEAYAHGDGATVRYYCSRDCYDAR